MRWAPPTTLHHSENDQRHFVGAYGVYTENDWEVLSEYYRFHDSWSAQMDPVKELAAYAQVGHASQSTYVALTALDTLSASLGTIGLEAAEIVSWQSPRDVRLDETRGRPARSGPALVTGSICADIGVVESVSTRLSTSSRSRCRNAVGPTK